MTPITHALLPVFLARRRLPANGEAGAWSARLWVMGFGALPDLLNPHLGLAARQASWSHSLAAWGVVGAILLVTNKWIRVPARGPVAVWCAAAYLAHLGCDAITGGVPLWRPWSSRIVGDAWLGLEWWLVADGLLLAWAYYAWRWRALRERLRRARANG